MALLRIAVAVVLALNVGLVASGIAALTRDVSVAPLAARPPGPDIAAGRVSPRPTAEAILRRNPFDSEMGPLDVAPIPFEWVLAKLAAVQALEPLSVRECAGVSVLAVAQFEDPWRSSATLRVEGEVETQARVRRAGDRVAGGRVAYIGYNPLDASPAVWVENGAELCQARLFRSSLARPVSPAPAPAPSRPASALRADAEAPTRGEIAAGIRPLSSSLVQVDRVIVDPLFDRVEQYAKRSGERSMPDSKGRVGVDRAALDRSGLDLGNVSPNGVLARFGFQSNDRIVSVNGYRAGSLDAAFAVASDLRKSSQIWVEVERNGQLVALEIAIR